MLATDKFNSGGVGLQNAVLAPPSGEVLLAPPGVAFPIGGDDLGWDPGWPPVHLSRQAAHAWAVQPTGVGVGGQGVSCQYSRMHTRHKGDLSLAGHPGFDALGEASSDWGTQLASFAVPGRAHTWRQEIEHQKLYTKPGGPAEGLTASYKKN